MEAQLEQRALAEQKLPDKSHNLNSHGALGQTEAYRLVVDQHRCNGSLHGDEIPPSDDGGNTLFRNVAQLKTCNRNHQQRYAATAHPTEGEAAKESAAMLSFECDAEACSLGHGGWKSKNSEPDQCGGV